MHQVEVPWVAVVNGVSLLSGNLHAQEADHEDNIIVVTKFRSDSIMSSFPLLA